MSSVAVQAQQETKARYRYRTPCKDRQAIPIVDWLPSTDRSILDKPTSTAKLLDRELVGVGKRARCSSLCQCCRFLSS
jgi:hypothetical protein